jgi:hypothetical protein
MVTGVVNFVCPQGSTFRRTLTWKTGVTPINLTGYSARMQVRETHDSSTVVASITSGNGITLGGSAGTIELYLSNTTTANIRSGLYVYDLEVVAPNGDVSRLIEGKFEVTPEVTR